MDDDTTVYFTESHMTDIAEAGVDLEKKEHDETLHCQLVLVGDLANDEEIYKIAESFGFPVAVSSDGNDYLNDVTHDNIFVMADFSGTFYEAVYHTDNRIIGPTALRQCSEKGEVLPNNARPLYSMAMSGLVICFTGFRKRDELTKMITLIHNMGGSVRKDLNTKVTHLVANCCGGEKYLYAATFRVPIMSESWIYSCWEKRNDPSIYADAEDVMQQHKLKPFHGSKVCFYGFSDQERDHMIEMLHQNGGSETDLEDPNCTHVVVDESEVQNIPENTGPKCIIVKAEWFWASIQNEVCCDEKDFLFEDYLESLVTPGRRDSNGTPTTSSFRARKRKRLRDTMSRFIQNDSPAVHKRRSSISDPGLLSISGSFIDGTPSSPDGHVDDEIESITTDSPKRKSLSARHQVFLELLQTETNYVNILETIMTLFKNPLEEMIDDGRELLNVTELKIIFGNLIPIYDVHLKMLKVLQCTAANWKEDTCIGDIILRFAPDLIKAYPPFVNFFEETKDTLMKCDQLKPRFHAFLKIGQSKPECGRQTLQELLIRPVQRLPSISLLLNDILKHTQKHNPDYAALEQALSSIREVMTHINEDKRKTEGQMVMFDIFNGIDNCPPHLVSSHRSFVVRCDVIELTGDLSARGDSLVFYLFTDMLEICKKRSKAFNSLKSPNSTGGMHSAKQYNGKLYKHIQLISLSNIKRVIDIREADDCHNVFALVCRNQQDFKEKLLSFTMISDEDTDKLTFLKILCRQMANTVCKTDAENFLTPLDSKQLGLSTNDVLVGTLSKAIKFASQTRKKVGRAFSFNKTPNKLKRAVSSMMNPFGSTTNLTPSHQLSQMRLASCANLSEIACEPVKEETYVAPMSVQPTRRKNKCTSMSVASLGRL